MADKKFSELDPVGSLTGTEILPVIKEGLPKRTTVADVVANYVLKSGDTMTGQLVAPSYDVSGAKILSSTGFPEGVVTAPVGSIYIDKAITNGVSSWIKKSGTGNTGWSVLEGDPTITALAAHNTNGILTQTAADTFTGRTITGTTNQVTVTNGDGVSGNPTLSLPQDIHTGANPTFARATIQPTSGSGYINIKAAAAGGNRASFALHGYNATNTDSFEFQFRTDLPDVVAFVYDTSTATYLNMFTYRYLANEFRLYSNTMPNADSTYTLGTSSLYWKETYTNKLFLNSTATLDGSTAGQLKVSGLFMPVQAATASAPTYVKGAMYFDTTLNKLRIGGATGWETVTSS